MKDNLNMLTLSCQNKECMLRIRVGRIISKPALRIGAFTFCPLCGSKAASGQDMEESYWESIAQSYGLPVELMKMLYDTWIPGEHQKFSDYIEYMKKESECENRTSSRT